MSRIGDALLLAISRGYLRIVEAILNHPSVQNRLTPDLREKNQLTEVSCGLYHSAAFVYMSTLSRSSTYFCEQHRKAGDFILMSGRGNTY